MKGAPRPNKAIRPPLALGIEVLAWFAAVIPPTDDRTVMVRVSGLADNGKRVTLMAFYMPESRAWFDFSTGGPIDGTVEEWSELPGGAAPAAREPLTGQNVAKLAKGGNHFSLQLTAIGRSLPAGDYALQLAPASPSTSTIARTHG